MMDKPTFRRQILQLSAFSPAYQERLWQYQLKENPVLNSFYTELERGDPIFFPIEFFKAFALKTGGTWKEEQIFQSSGTTGQIPSQHFVRDLSWYREVVNAGFQHFFPKTSYRILALLPSYLERGNSSLVYMVKTWMDHWGLPGSGFYLYNFDALEQAIVEAKEAREPILLIGVTFALLEFASKFPISLSEGDFVMETGGMKGRGEELTRDALHLQLSKAFQGGRILSEYGMTELMSQAYAFEAGRFVCPPWMRVEILDVNLPTQILEVGYRGRIGIVDLANIDSCGFILTDDLGVKHEDGSFEVLGRVEYSELRGCNLMYA